MPWSVQQNHPDCEASKPWAVVKDSDGSVAGCHETQADAEAQQRALYASEGDMAELQVPMEPLAPRWRMLAVDDSLPLDDSRGFRDVGVVTWREPPLAFTWTDKISDGHLGAELGGTVDRIERQGSQVWLYGTFADTEDGMQVLELVRAKAPLFPSVSLGDTLETWEVDDLGRETMVWEQAKIIGVTLTPEQAQEGTFIELDEEPAPIAACAGPALPSIERFRKPPLSGPTSLSVSDDGHVFGNVAGPGCHIGVLDRCVKVGVTSRDFTLFHKGLQGDGGGILTAEGERVRVGQITLVGGHADLHLSADAARRHYDDTRSAVADVVVGWDPDDDLPWFSGSLRPGVTEDQVQALRASGVSGDWRVIEGEHRLVALPAVNVPGFPVRVRALVASGEVQAFVAKLPPPDDLAALTAKLQQGNIEPMMEWYCAGADGQINWGTPGDFEACVAIAEGHLDDPQAFCQTMHERCVGTPSGEHAITASALAALALERMDAKVWGPELERMDRTLAPVDVT